MRANRTARPRRRRRAQNAPADVIRVLGARQNNLQDIDVEIPVGAITAITGVSGSGKSSLAFDTLYAEGQRRYVESFSPYARQFIDRMDRPAVRAVEGVLPAVAIDQKNAIRASRSTVGTVTELTDFIKLLYARVALLHCQGCGQPVRSDEPGAVAERLLAEHSGRRLVLTFGVEAASAKALDAALEWLASQGYRRLFRDGQVVALDGDGARPAAPGTLEVLVDRLTLDAGKRGRLVDSLEAALGRGRGRATAHLEPRRGEWIALPLSRGRHCAACQLSYPAAVPSHFSYNSPLGACSTCNGFGAVIDLDLDLVIPDGSLSLADGAVRPWNTESTTRARAKLLAYCRRARIPTRTAWRELTDAQRELVIEGDRQRGWTGVRGWFRRKERKSYKMHVRVFLSRYRAYVPCEACDGSRFDPHALLYRLDGLTLAQLYRMSLEQAREQFATIALPPDDATAMAPVLEEIRSRLRYLCEVGVGYLTLDRQSRTLSGGEVQRVNLTTAIGSALVNTLYVLDEPSVGLHARDNQRLMEILERLRANRNTIVLVEHEEAIIRRCDHLIDLGPGPGEAGGRLVYAGPPAGLGRAEESATARCLAGVATMPAPRRRAASAERAIVVRGAAQNNLQQIDVAFPLETLTVVSGVSGSGKSTLIEQVLHRGLMRLRGRPTDRPGAHRAIEGAEALADVVLVDQTPAGTTPRSNAATYIKAFDPIRRLFAEQPEAQRRGFGPGAFSFNAAGGRCDACDGNGFERIEMQFLSDCFVTCEKCGGSRFKAEVLEVRLGERSIADVLALTVEQARRLFADRPQITRRLAVLERVGLGYLRLGQPLNTLSGGESQRLKLAHHLAVARTRGTLFLLDEPTTGLHLSDVQTLIENLQQLVDAGNTVVVIEHHLDIVAQADHVIDLGPEGGAAGGRVLFSGPPEALTRCRASHTGRFLREHLSGATRAAEARPQRPRFQAPAEITLRGARVHNLRDVDLELPRDQLVVITGPSGSGKSSLAFDVLFAEGQRRFVDCLSPYARQYVAQVGRPDLDELAGVPPTVSISQHTSRGGHKSTVATLTEIYHYLRLIYARAGVQHCPRCDARVSGLAAEDLIARIVARHAGKRVRLLAPVIRGRKGWHKDVFKRARARGHAELRVDGKLLPLEGEHELSRYQEHDIEYVVDRLTVGPRAGKALGERVAEALELGDGTIHVLEQGRRRPRKYSLARYCADCSIGFDPPDPRGFSFNSRAGACPSCGGTGVAGDPEADDGLEGATIARRLHAPCDACGGSRLRPEALAVKLAGRSIAQLCALTVGQLAAFVQQLALPAREQAIVGPALEEVAARCRFLGEMGLEYLTLDRGAPTLSGGEGQRVRLAAQLSAQLRGVLYLLDEPTIGLHPVDNERLLAALERLCARGNTVVVVEHDEETIRRSDYLVDMGPGGGTHGGEVIAAGPTAEVLRSQASLTARCLRQGGAARAVWRDRAVEARHPCVRVREATHHNLQRLEVAFPIGRLTVVSGVSGSGKSSLARDVLGEGLRRLAAGQQPNGGRLEGAELLSGVREIDQSPIGKTPASTPATYVGLQDSIRQLFARLPEARARGYTPGRFSYNVAGGRCETCRGQGRVKHEMSFLPHVYVPCEACATRRFNDETLEVRYREHSIGQVLELTAEQARELFAAVPALERPLGLLCDVGLDYLQLGQPSNTLSGGEAQRIKLVEELRKEGGRRGRPGSMLYIMDEPSTGLHMDDLTKLLGVLQRLVDRGDTVVVIEHNLDVIASADWLVDLGPEGGERGGQLLYQGPRAGLCKVTASRTARYLRDHLRQTSDR